MTFLQSRHFTRKGSLFAAKVYAENRALDFVCCSDGILISDFQVPFLDTLFRRNQCQIFQPQGLRNRLLWKRKHRFLFCSFAQTYLKKSIWLRTFSTRIHLVVWKFLIEYGGYSHNTRFLCLIEILR